MNEVFLSISKSIKEGKWLYINYVNANNDSTFFWIAIKDIDIDKKELIVTAFNASKISHNENGVIDIRLKVDQIISAELIDGTTYVVPEKLYNMFDNNLVYWLKADAYDEKILSYYKECIYYDQPPYLRENNLVSGVEEESLISQSHGLKLNLLQISQLTKGLEKQLTSEKENQNISIELAINLLSIYTPKGLYNVAYKRVLFDAETGSLKLQNTIEFNFTFIVDDKDLTIHSIRNYLDVETDHFLELFEENRHEAKELLSMNLRRGEKLDDKPFIFNIVRSFTHNVHKEFEGIQLTHETEGLSAPLDAFFGNMATNRLGKKSNYNIILLNENLNIDQLRVIHNALKNPITYVQGPPGTGKTQSIINLLITVLFNNQTALVTSNNNKPIDDIFEKLQKLTYYDRLIPLPIIRLGNAEKVSQALKWIREVMDKYAHDMARADEEKIKRQWNFNHNNFKVLNEMINDYEERIELIEKSNILKSLLESFVNNPKSSILEIEYQKVTKRLNEIPIIEDKDMQGQVSKVDRTFTMWLYFTSLQRLKKLTQPKFADFRGILEIEDENIQIREFNRYLSSDENLHLLMSVFPIIMSTNQSVPKLGTPKVHFDLTIIDEAGQCSIGNSLYPILRGRKLLLVGDQNQLQPVVSLNPNKNKSLMEKYHISKDYSYLSNSILKVMTTVDSISKFVLLRYHYRSDPKIINFSNKKYYNSQLIIESKPSDLKQSLYYIETKEHKDLNTNVRNVAKSEALKIIEDIKASGKNNVGVITPFRNQAILIQEELKERGMDNVTVGTVHTYQGDEKDTIYLSTCVTPHTLPKTYDWVRNNQELINVATTRAKKELIIVGDYNEVKKRSKPDDDYLELMEYTRNNGKEINLSSSSTNVLNSISYKQYNTNAEKELLETIKHFLSFGDKYTVQTQVKVSQLLYRFTQPELFDFGTKSTFDFVLFKKIFNDEIPVLVIELDGPEHYYNKQSILNDQKKNQICKDNNIKLLRIPNEYSRRYIFVKEQIINILKDK